MEEWKKGGCVGGEMDRRMGIRMVGEIYVHLGAGSCG